MDIFCKKIPQEYDAETTLAVHGHRALPVGKKILLFGGGNVSINNRFRLYNTETNRWAEGLDSGEKPKPVALFGFDADDECAMLFGGLLADYSYTNDLYELQLKDWKWRKIETFENDSEAPPIARFGHTLTRAGNKMYVFGGMILRKSSEPSEPSSFICQSDFRSLEIMHTKVKKIGEPDTMQRTYAWTTPAVNGPSPCARVSHTVVSFYDRRKYSWMLILYGGMGDHRLNDLWIFNTKTLIWIEIKTTGTVPMPRSLHTANVIGNEMFVCGGWTSTVESLDVLKTLKLSKQYVCSNSLYALNLNKMKWRRLIPENRDYEWFLSPRVGHAAVAIASKLYFSAGQYRNEVNPRLNYCFDDLWSVCPLAPLPPDELTLLSMSKHSLNVYWRLKPSTVYYVVQIQLYSQTGKRCAEAEGPAILAAPVAEVEIVSEPVVFKKPFVRPRILKKIGSTTSTNAMKAPIMSTSTITTTTNNNVVKSPIVDNKENQRFQVIVIENDQEIGKINLIEKEENGVRIVTHDFEQTTTAATNSPAQGNLSTQSDITTNDPNRKRENETNGAVPVKRVKLVLRRPGLYGGGDDEPAEETSPKSLNPLAHLATSIIESDDQIHTLSKVANNLIRIDSGLHLLAKVVCDFDRTNDEHEQQREAREREEPKQEDFGPWYVVNWNGSTMLTINEYLNKSFESIHWDVNRMPDMSLEPKYPLLPGKEYRVRVTGLNGHGMSNYVVSSVFRTNRINVPVAPTACDAIPTETGIQLFWTKVNPAADQCAEPMHYTVHMSLHATTTTQRKFYCLAYSGIQNECFVAKSVVQNHLKGCLKIGQIIFFRIMAKNSAGFSSPLETTCTVSAILAGDQKQK